MFHRVRTRFSFLLALVALAPLTCFSQTAPFNLPAQPLAESLKAVGAQTNINVMVSPSLVDGRVAPALKAQLSARDALKRLLEGTGLEYTFVNDQTVVIREKTPAATPASAASVDQNGALRTGQEAGKEEVGKKSSQEFRVAQVGQGTTSSLASVATNPSTSPDSTKSIPLTEIVVTAQKRAERLQDVPVPVTALSAQSLVDSNEVRLQDYYSSVPALNLTPNYNGTPNITIRGLTTGNGSNPTVGVVVDDVPFGSSSALGGGFYVPDVDPSELARIEVLRGPQGTLYGASSLGGLLKYVTIDPSTEALTGRIQAGGSGVQNGSGLGYSFRAAVNVPVSDVFAFRASGFTRKDPGYIDDPVRHVDGVNQTEVSGGRLAALWKASDSVSLKMSALFQDTRVHGSNDVDVQAGLGDLQQIAPPGTGERDTKIQSFNATVTATLGAVNLVSVSGYSVATDSGSTDATQSVYGTLIVPYLYPGTSGAAIVEDLATRKFTQEFRLSGPIGTHVDWLAGAFYTHERSHFNQAPSAIDANTGAYVGLLDNGVRPTTFEEYAAFGDLTFHLTDRFDVQVGGRDSENRQSYSIVWTGPAVPLFFLVPSPLIPPPVKTKDNSFTYLVTPQFRLTPDLMLYARFASGYRPGGPNDETTLNKSPTFGPDKTQNYEIGFKGELFDHKLSIDASAYTIDWRNIQIQVYDPASLESNNINAGRAKSRGLEISTEWRPLSGLTLSAWGAWNHAELTESFPPDSLVVGAAGDRLPYSSRFSGNFSFKEDFPLGQRVTGFLAGAVSYVGDRKGGFLVTSQRQDLPAYAKTDLRLGASVDSWEFNVAVTNLADRRGLLIGGLDNINANSYDYIPPRTVGFSATKQF